MEIASGGTIEVTVTNVEGSEGQIRALLFNSAEGFPENSKNAFNSISVPAKLGKTVLKFEDVPFGSYAISVLHDRNSDGELSTNLFGYPQEGYGVSNNSTSAFSIPKYKDAQFEHQEETRRVLIHLRN